MGTCRDPSNKCVSGTGLLVEMNNKIEQKGYQGLNRTIIFLRKWFTLKISCNFLKEKKNEKKKAPPIKHSVLISFQNHGEKLLEVGPTSKNIWHLRI